MKKIIGQIKEIKAFFCLNVAQTNKKKEKSLFHLKVCFYQFIIEHFNAFMNWFKVKIEKKM